MTQASLDGFYDAWMRWSVGRLADDSRIYGLKVLWWARIGQVLQFFAATTVIADILGPERLRRFGASLHCRFTMRWATDTLRQTFRFAYLMLKSAYMREGHRRELVVREVQRSRWYLVGGLLSLAVGTVVAYVTWSRVPWWGSLIAALLSCGASLGIGFPLLAVASTAFIALIGAVADGLIIEPLAWVLERTNPEAAIKLLSLLLFITGFALSMLGS